MMPICVNAGLVIVGEAVCVPACRRQRLQGFRKAEVQHLHRSVGSQLDIRGLQIAVNDALLVRRFEGFRDLLRDGQRLVERDRATRQPLRQILALDEFHHQGLDALGVFQPVDGRNVRMIQRGEDFRFALEPRHAVPRQPRTPRAGS